MEKSKEWIERQQAEIDNVAQMWKEELNRLISEVSQKFSNFFEAMGCAGEVKLQFENEVSSKLNGGVQICFKVVSIMTRMHS